MNNHKLMYLIAASANFNFVDRIPKIRLLASGLDEFKGADKELKELGRRVEQLLIQAKVHASASLEEIEDFENNLALEVERGNVFFEGYAAQMTELIRNKNMEVCSILEVAAQWYTQTYAATEEANADFLPAMLLPSDFNIALLHEDIISLDLIPSYVKAPNLSFDLFL